MNRFELIKESLMATALTIFLTFLISFIPLKFEFAKFIRQGYLDFDLYDLYFSGRQLKNIQRDSNIVIVEIGNDRDQIADQIMLLQNYSPAVIAVDAVFEKELDPVKDNKLNQAILQSGNMIFATRYDDNPLTGHPSVINNYFDKKDSHYHSGYTNFHANQFSVIRNYPPFIKTGDSVYMAFTSAIAKLISPEKFNKLKKRNNELEIINYSGNLESYTNMTDAQLKYYAKTGQLGNILSQKIVLLGYFVKDRPQVLEDLHFSPLNDQITGKSFPDMYGVVIHANILSMVLGGNFAKKTSEMVSYIVAAVIVFLFIYYMLSQYKKKIHPRHGLFLLIQVILILVMMYLFLQVFNWFQLKIPIMAVMIALVLSVELLGIYRTIALWLHGKYEYKTVFSHKHII